MLRIARENPLQWRDGTQVRERTITLHSTRRSQLLRSLRGMLNVLHYGEPVSTRVRNRHHTERSLATQRL